MIETVFSLFLFLFTTLPSKNGCFWDLRRPQTQRIVKWSKGLLTHLLNPTEIKVGFCPKLRFLLPHWNTFNIAFLLCKFVSKYRRWWWNISAKNMSTLGSQNNKTLVFSLKGSFWFDYGTPPYLDSGRTSIIEVHTNQNQFLRYLKSTKMKLYLFLFSWQRRKLWSFVHPICKLEKK